MDVTSYLLGKNASGGGSTTLQDKEVTITTNTTTNIEADEGYDGLNSVAVTTNVGGSGSEYFYDSLLSDVKPTPYMLLKKISGPITIEPKSGTSPVRDYTSTFESCSGLVQSPSFVFAQTNLTPTNVNSMFKNCTSLTVVGLFDTSNVTKTTQMFQNCSSLTEIPNFDFTNVTTATQMFQGCSSLVTAPSITFTKLQNCVSMFKSCTNLENVPIYDTSKIQSFWMNDIFNNCPKLTDTSLDNILQMCINATGFTGTKTLSVIGISNMTTYPTSRIEALPHYQDFINAGWTIGY